MNWIQKIVELNPVIMYLTGVVSSVLTWFFVKKKFIKKDLALKDNEIAFNATTSIKNNIEIYQIMIDDFTNLINKYKTEVEALETQINRLKETLTLEDERHQDNVQKIEQKYRQIITDLKKELKLIKESKL